jgi:Transposase DDE domain
MPPVRSSPYFYSYNVQIAVDAEHHLIVAHAVINQGYDPPPAGTHGVQGTAGHRPRADHRPGRPRLLQRRPGPDLRRHGRRTGRAQDLNVERAKRGFFTRQDFIYDAEHDHYTCPAGAKLTKARRRADHTEDFDFYRHLSACFTCPLRSRCTPTKLRRIKRWEHEDVLDRMQDRLDRMPEAMGVRRQTVEHPFGTLKAWMGATHFLTLTLDKVRTEMSLHVLAYNLKRMIAIFGAGPLMAAIRT